MGRKLGDVPPFLATELGPIQHNVAWAEAYLHAKCHLGPSIRLATTDMGRKLRGCAPLGWGSWVPI